MADQQVTSTLQTIEFRKDFMREWVRNNRLSAYTGKGANNVICQKMGSGPTLRHPLVTRLKGSGVTGADMLRGNGESIGNYSWDTNPTYFRHAVEFNKEDLEKTNLELMAEARPLLLEWAMSATRDRMIQALGAIYDGTTYTNPAVTSSGYETIADAWLVANKARTQFGAYASGGSAGGTDYSADLGQLDTSADTFVYARAEEMRRLAENADPHIRPYQSNEEGEVYLVLCGSHTHKQLRDSLVTINTSADVRGMKITAGSNILARDGDLFYNGMIFRKVPEITKFYSVSGRPLHNRGNSGTNNVEPVFLCGMQALVHGMGEAPDIIVDRTYDYNFRPGVAVELKEDIKKTFFNGIQHGVVSGFFAVPA